MKNKFLSLFRLLVILIFCISLFGQQITIVKADLSCTWNGLVSSDWNTIGNWSDCTPLNGSPRVPNATDDAIIPDTTRDPVFSVESEAITVRSLTVLDGGVVSVHMYGGISADTITIDEGGSVVMHGHTVIDTTTTITNNGTLTSDNIGSPYGEANLTIYSTTFTNAGTIHLTGNSDSSISINSGFDNSGTVQIDAGGIVIYKGGTHTGDFLGATDTYLGFNANGFPSLTLTFEEDSLIDFPTVLINGFEVNFNGVYSFIHEFDLIIDDGTIFTFQSSSEINYLGQLSSYNGEVIFSDNPNDYRIQELRLGGTGIVQNDDSLEILSNFDWRGGTLKGSGTTEVATTSLFRLWISARTLDGHDLTNKTTANWDGGGFALSNGATFTNDGTFNANQETYMSGGAAGTFVNNAVFSKKTSGTTTTITTDFENNGEVEVQAGTLIFTGNLTSGGGTTIDLGDGSLEPGETLTLEAGALLVGSGTLSSNLVNGGTVNPGSSPGIITVDGDYTQSADGILAIELAGTNPASDFDQLIVTGAASLDGVCNVTLIELFIPHYGDTFEIISATTLNNTFDTLSLPDLPSPLEWEVDYAGDGLTISVAGGGEINGTATYTGTLHTGHEITIGLHSAVNDPPLVSLGKSSGDPYSFVGVPDGTYYISAFIDADDSGGAPDPDEPFEWYVDGDGNPLAITISAGNTVNDADILLKDSTFFIFLPLTLR